MLNITREQAKWILASYAPIKDYGKVTNHKNVILETLSILRGKPVHLGCNCELPALARITSDMYNQHKSEIETIANQEVINNDIEAGSREVKKTRKKKIG